MRGIIRAFFSPKLAGSDVRFVLCRGAQGNNSGNILINRICRGARDKFSVYFFSVGTLENGSAWDVFVNFASAHQRYCARVIERYLSFLHSLAFLMRGIECGIPRICADNLECCKDWLIRLFGCSVVADSTGQLAPYNWNFQFPHAAGATMRAIGRPVRLPYCAGITAEAFFVCKVSFLKKNF